MKKMLILLPTFLGQNGKSLDMTWRLKKKIAVNFWYTRDTHWLIKSLLLVGVNTVVLSDWVVGETREILNDHARGWRRWNYARRSPDLGRACGSNLKGRLICPLHVVSRLSSADPADGYSSIKIAMIKQNLWWTMFPARFLFPLPKPPHGHKEDFAEERDPSRSPLHFHRTRHVIQARKFELLLKVTKDNQFQVCLSCHTTWRMIARVGFDCNWLQ